jgi:hypothetical protein
VYAPLPNMYALPSKAYTPIPPEAYAPPSNSYAPPPGGVRAPRGGILRRMRLPQRYNCPPSLEACTPS